MRVSKYKTRVLRTPADNPLVVGLPEGNATRTFVTLRLNTDEGILGWSRRGVSRRTGPSPSLYSPVSSS